MLKDLVWAHKQGLSCECMQRMSVYCAYYALTKPLRGCSVQHEQYACANTNTYRTCFTQVQQQSSL